MTYVPPSSIQQAETSECNNRYPSRERHQPERFNPTALVVASTALFEPSTTEKAIESPFGPQWKLAMKTKMQSLIRNKTWDLIPLPVYRKPVGCRRIFKLKYGIDGSIESLKPDW